MRPQFLAGLRAHPAFQGWVGGSLVCAGLLLLAGTLCWAGLGPLRDWLGLPLLSVAPERTDAPIAGAEEAHPRATELVWTREKIAAAGIKIEPSVRRNLCRQRSVPGRLNYDEARRLVLTASVECFVQRVLVQTRQNIDQGQPLLELTAPEIGLARDEVQFRDAERKLAQRKAEWTTEIARNAQLLLDRMSGRPSQRELDQEFQERSLGGARDALLGAYAKWSLAQALQANSQGLSAGVLSGRQVLERESELHQAESHLRTAMEQVRFDQGQAREEAQAALEKAERLLAVSRQRLAALLGPFVDPAAVPNAEQLNECQLRAPFAGRIEERHVPVAARVAAGGPLLTLADSRTLWVEAEIHESEWTALELQPGETLNIRLPALPEQSFPAVVKHLGGAVTEETRAVPLIAELDNSQGQFRPGQFVWIDVPLEASREALAVPAGALMQEGDAHFVFVAEGSGRFRRVDVRPGLVTPEWAEIASGLAVGQPVVTSGAFALKSELLLEPEE